MPMEAKRSTSFTSNQTTRFLPVAGSGASLQSKKAAAGKRQRRSELAIIERQKSDAVLRTLLASFERLPPAALREIGASYFR